LGRQCGLYIGKGSFFTTSLYRLYLSETEGTSEILKGELWGGGRTPLAQIKPEKGEECGVVNHEGPAGNLFKNSEGENNFPNKREPKID